MNLEKLEPITDTRGSLVNAFQLSNDGQIFYVWANPGEMRGQHYHIIKTESFIVLQGNATISVKDRVTSDVMKVELNGNKPMRVTVSPNHTHNIVAGKQGCLFMVWSNTNYDAENEDTYKEEL